MAKQASQMEPQAARDYLECVAESHLGKACLNAMGLGMVAYNPLGGNDEQTVDIAMKLSLQIYRRFRPRSKRGFSWGDGDNADSDLAASHGGVGDESKGKGKRSRNG